MSEPARISPDEAFEKMSVENPALLVCAYSQEKYDASHLMGAISLNDLESEIPKLDKAAEIIFY